MKKILAIVCMCLLLVGCNTVWSESEKSMIIDEMTIDRTTPKICRYKILTPIGGNMIFYVQDCPFQAGDKVKLTKVEETNDTIKK